MQTIKLALAASLVATLALVGCGPKAPVEEIKVIGSGASFPAPIYAKWFKDFSAANEGVTVDYQKVGSGAGIKDFINQTVDFAASDAAMKESEIAKVPAERGGVLLLPMTAGQVVLAYNLEGVELQLPRDVYPEIFLGNVTMWNDPRIAAANPGVELPAQEITVVTRSDSSGTTYVFTNHLSDISDAFKAGPGVGKKPQWPSSDKFIAGPKNDGVAALIKQTPGAIGYVEYGYAKVTGLPTVKLENAAGNFVGASAESGAAALASAVLPENLVAWVTDPAGENAYPIATFTWMLFYKEQDDAKAKVLRDMVEFGLTEGQKMAEEMGYIPLPENVIAKVREAAKGIQ